ncbi:MAG: hypothetical protein M1814_005101 [Vezdaea aestivalis]|nr:MAG: hypothetical protein M1814_005101 [Vezdaea aestivalis]
MTEGKIGNNPLSQSSDNVESPPTNRRFPFASLSKPLTALLLALICIVLPHLEGKEWGRYHPLKNLPNPTIKTLVLFPLDHDAGESRFQIPKRFRDALISRFGEFHLKDLLYHKIDFQADSSHFLGADQSPLLGKDHFLSTILERNVKKVERDVKKGESGIEYSNEAYALASILVEHVSGRSFASMMDEYIFKPLGMYNSFVGADHSTDIAVCYNQMSNRSLERIKAPTCPSSVPWAAAAGIYGTLGDWCKFQQAMIRLFSRTGKADFKEFAKQCHKDFHINREALYFLFGTNNLWEASSDLRCPLGLVLTTGSGQVDCSSLDKSIYDVDSPPPEDVLSVACYYHAGATTGFTLTSHIIVNPEIMPGFALTVVSNSTGLIDPAAAVAKFIITSLLIAPKSRPTVIQHVNDYIRTYLPEALTRVRALELSWALESSLSDEPLFRVKTAPCYYKCAKTSRSFHFRVESGRLFVHEQCDNHHTGHFLINRNEDGTRLRLVPTRRGGDPPRSIDQLVYPPGYPDLEPSDLDSDGMATVIKHVTAKPCGDINDPINLRVYEVQSGR